MTLTPEQRTLRARMAAYTMHAKYSTTETTAASHASFLAGFERQVDPEGLLAPDERQRRAVAARKAHMARLALRSSLARA